MDKCYFVIALNGNKEGQMVGVYCADNALGKPASKNQERELMYNYSNPTPSLMDAWLEGEYNNMRVFNRADARKVARELNTGVHGRTFFYWMVREVGESTRAVNKEKPLGWRVMVSFNYGKSWEPSSYNRKSVGASVKVDHSALFPGAMENSTYYLFATRAESRKWIADGSIAGLRYRAIPVYASELCYRIEGKDTYGAHVQAAITDIYGNTYTKGLARRAFTTQDAAEQCINQYIEKRHQHNYRIVVDWRYNA